MVINKPAKVNRVKFISYTGAYPNLCSGILTLEIDGKVCTFGRSIYKEPQGEYRRFWSSGGCYGGYDPEFISREWEIDVDDLPEQFREYADEIDEVFNENVEWGCCGGCV